MWLWQGQPFILEDLDWSPFGFVYLISNRITGKKYVGRKYFGSIRRLKVRGKKNRTIMRKPSDWENYWGSSKYLQEDVVKYGEENFTREILSLHESRADVNYHELKEQILRDVLVDPDYINENIACRYYRKKNQTQSIFAVTVVENNC